MRPSHLPSKALMTVLVTLVPSTLLPVMPTEAMAQGVVPLGPFRSVTLRNGGRVILRHAPNQRVTLLKGARDHTKVTIEDGDRLVIDRHHGGCSEEHDLAVEVLAPDLDDIMVMDGGMIQSRGSFPRQVELRVKVEDGGTIDLRSMSVDRVTAAVRDGGRILTKPRESLVARIAQGGAVTYWGNPRVTSSVEKGGVVVRGAASDADKPLRDLGPGSHALPPLPPVPPTRGRRSS